MRPSFISVQKLSLIIHPAIPVGTHNNPFSSINFTMCCLPSLYALSSQQKIFVVGGFSGAIYDIHWSNKPLYIQAIGITILIVLAGNPMVRRVKMRAGVFAKL